MSNTQDTPKKKEEKMPEELVIDEQKDNEGKEPDSKKPAWTDEMQAEFDRRAAALRKAAAADARKQAAAEFEAKQAAEKDALEKARLADEGKYKEVAEKADLAKSAAEKRAEEAEQKAKALALQIAFNAEAAEMSVSFVNKQAAADAFERLDLSLVGDDNAGMRKAIEQLQKDRPYYFGQAQANQANTDASQRGKRQTNQKSEEELDKEIMQRFNIRKPR